MTTFEYRHMHVYHSWCHFPFFLAWAGMTARPSKLSKSQSETRPNQIFILRRIGSLKHPRHVMPHMSGELLVVGVGANQRLFVSVAALFIFLGRERDGSRKNLSKHGR